jgi:hypothetical protein
MTKMTTQEAEKHYKDITDIENITRLKLLIEFRELVKIYFNNSTLNMMSGSYIEEQEAKEARVAINLIMNRAYKIIRLADINPIAASYPSSMVGKHGLNIDLILNIFNLGRNDISPNAAIANIERAIDVYKSRTKKNWLYLPIVTVIAFVLVVMSAALIISKNKVSQRPIAVVSKEGQTDSQRIDQYNKSIEALGTAEEYEKELSSSKDLVQEEEYKNVDNANKSIGKTVADNKYASQTIYTIQIGSFVEIERAQKQFDFIAQGLDEKELDYLRIEKIGKFYTIRLGKYEDPLYADKFLMTVKPHIPTAIMLNAYIKDKRIIRIYKDSILSDR